MCNNNIKTWIVYFYPFPYTVLVSTKRKDNEITIRFYKTNASFITVVKETQYIIFQQKKCLVSVYVSIVTNK